MNTTTTQQGASEGEALQEGSHKIALRRAFVKVIGPLYQSLNGQSFGADKTSAAHLSWMCKEILNNIRTMQPDKISRWIGFIQGVMAANGLLDVDEERNRTRPLFEAAYLSARSAPRTVAQASIEELIDGLNEQAKASRVVGNKAIGEKIEVLAKHLLRETREAFSARPAPAEDEYEYATTTGPRKSWYSESEPPEGEGWERDTEKGRNGWERFEYHEEAYWRRKKPSSTPASRPTEETGR